MLRCLHILTSTYKHSSILMTPLISQLLSISWKNLEWRHSTSLSTCDTCTLHTIVNIAGQQACTIAHDYYKIFEDYRMHARMAIHSSAMHGIKKAIFFMILPIILSYKQTLISPVELQTRVMVSRPTLLLPSLGWGTGGILSGPTTRPTSVADMIFDVRTEAFGF